MSVSSVILLRSDVPKYLHTSELYLSFSKEGDDEISVPSDCIKFDLQIVTINDLRELLLTMRFWILTSFPNELIEFLIDAREWSTGVVELLEEFATTLPGLSHFIKELHDLPSSSCINITAKHGRLDFLEHFIRCQKPLDCEAIVLAAENGHDNCLSMIWNELIKRDKSFTFQGKHQCWEVIKRGHLKCLQCIVELGHPIDPGWCSQAAICDQLECLKYFLSASTYRGEHICAAATQYGTRRCLQCAVEFGCELTAWTWHTALYAPSAAGLEYLIDKFPQYPNYLVRMACSEYRGGGHVVILPLQRLHESGCLLPPNIVEIAASEGCMANLHYLQQIGYNCWVPSTMTTAARKGRLRLIQELHAQGCPWDESAPTAALRGDYEQCLKFFLQLRGIPQSLEFNSIVPEYFCNHVLTPYRDKEALKDTLKHE